MRLKPPRRRLVLMEGKARRVRVITCRLWSGSGDDIEGHRMSGPSSKNRRGSKRPILKSYLRLPEQSFVKASSCS